MGDPNFKPRTGAQISWMVLILPQLEEQALYDRYEIAVDAAFYPNSTNPQAASVAVYACPSDRAPGRLFQHASLSQDRPFAKGNYAAYVSPQHVGDQQFIAGALGGFRPGEESQRGQRLHKIKDGTTRTIAITEVLTTEFAWDHRGAWSLPWGGSSLLCVHVDHDFDRLGDLREDQRTVEHYAPDPRFLSWAHIPNTQQIADILYACPTPALARQLRMPCVTSDGGWAYSYVTSAPRSHHRNGVNAGLLDGHVGFLSDDIDIVVLTQLVSVNDGIPIDATEFVP
jgi:hypothetical protein